MIGINPDHQIFELLKDIRWILPLIAFLYWEPAISLNKRPNYYNNNENIFSFFSDLKIFLKLVYLKNLQFNHIIQYIYEFLL